MSAVHKADKSFRFSAVVKTSVQGKGEKKCHSTGVICQFNKLLWKLLSKSVCQDAPELKHSKSQSTQVLTFLCQDRIDHYYTPLAQSWMFFKPFRYVLRSYGLVSEPKELFQPLLVGLGACRWSVQIVTAWSHSAVWPCLRGGKWASNPFLIFKKKKVALQFLSC